MELPVPDAAVSLPLAVSPSGAFLWSRTTKELLDPNTGASVTHYDLLLGATDGTPPTMFGTTLPRTVSPTAGWAASDQAWYVAGRESDSHGNRYVSIWHVTADGTASRLACTSLARADAGPPPDDVMVITDGVVGDGAVYVSLWYPGGFQQLARVQLMP